MNVNFAFGYEKIGNIKSFGMAFFNLKRIKDDFLKKILQRKAF